ncbi:hypothetical protein Tco_0932236, partial [Tanacetum coccineum]
MNSTWVLFIGGKKGFMSVCLRMQGKDEFDQEALRYTLEEEARFKRQDEERLKEKLAEQEWEGNMDYYHPSNWTQEEESFEVEPYNRNLTIV